MVGIPPGVEPRGTGKLTAIGIRALSAPGRYGDGRGLYLVVRPDSKAWVLRYRCRVTGKQRDMGLGALADVSLADARAKRNEIRRMLANGLDPIAERQASRDAARIARAKVKTFAECCRAYIEAHRKGWKNEKHLYQWRRTLEKDAGKLAKLPVSEIDTGLVLDVLNPIWSEKTETATRVRQRVEAVLDWARVRGYREGENPARWRGHLDKLLPAPSKVRKVTHQPAMPWADVPAFMAELRKRSGTSAALLELVILTACRVGEAAAARWDEFDLDGGRWTIPAERMKTGKEHQAALSSAAVDLLCSIKRTSQFVFPGIGRLKNSHINPESARKLLQTDLGHKGITVHGFRSSFRDWSAESTAYPAEVIEMALAHAIENRVEAAYRRGDLFKKRSKLMQAWANYLGKLGSAENVTPIRTAGAAG